MTYGLSAEKDWRKFLPKLVAQMEPGGRVVEALWEARETALDEMELLTRRMKREQQMTPEQAQAMAWEFIRERYILPPPEESAPRVSLRPCGLRKVIMNAVAS